MKINDLDTRKGQIDSNYYNVETCKRNLQRQITHVQNLQANAVGKFFRNEKKKISIFHQFCQFLSDLDKEDEKFKKKTETILKSLTDTQKQKLEAVKKLKAAAHAMEYNRKKQRIFLRSTAELEHRIQEAQEKLNTAIVISVVKSFNWPFV